MIALSDCLVALHAEGVDRNPKGRLIALEGALSPSMRRAWIEIVCQEERLQSKTSPSMRRAWIEIGHRGAELYIKRSPSMRRAWIEIW